MLCNIKVVFEIGLKSQFFLAYFYYYLAYFYYYLWVSLHFLVLFIGSTVLFQLLFRFIYSIFNINFLVSAK